MKSWMIILLFLMCNVFTLLIIAITPYITRKTESFGVTIPEEEHDNEEIRKLRKNYRNRTIQVGGTISFLALLLPLFSPSDITLMAIPASVLLLIPIMFLFYWEGHKKMKAIKAERQWGTGKTQMIVMDTGFRNKKTMASPLWFILFAIVILTTAVFGVVLYDKIPDRIPMHWNINGDVDRYADKSYGTVLWAPVVQIFLSLIMAFSYWLISKSRQMIDAANPEKSMEQNRTFRYRWSIFSIASGLAMNIMFGVIQFFTYGIINNHWLIIVLPMAVGLGVVVAAIIISITTGQGGSRVYKKTIKSGDKTEGKIISRDEDRFWKLGLFYYNPEDPSFIVEKRFGIGWTNNWARPVSWLITLGLVLAIIGFSILSAVMTK